MTRAHGSGSWYWQAARGLMAAALAATLLAACGYRPLGADGATAGHRLSVETITNETMRPGIQGVVSTALLRQLRFRGLLRSPEAGPADLVLSGGVVGYQNDAIAFDAQDIGRRFRVRVIVQAKLEGRPDAKVILNEAVVGEAFYTAGVGAVSARNAEDEAMQFAAQDAASKLVARLLEEL